jgi:4-amino-4-deoxy-L-arabinose transferase-like glycosyltransferase
MKNRLKNSIFDYGLVLIIGAGILLLFYLYSFPHLIWRDELSYVEMGRNIATGRGWMANGYDPDFILQHGFPLSDVHMPGHMMVLALYFWLFGPGDGVALLPSQLACLLTGLLLYGLGRHIFTRWVGFAAVGLFFLFPAIVTYTHSAMSEISLVFLATLYLAVWYKTLVAPRLLDSAWLAIILVVGAVYRETFLVFLPAALYGLWRAPWPQRKKAWLLFSGVFLILMLTVFIPLYRARAPYPSFDVLGDMRQAVSLTEYLQSLAQTFSANLLQFGQWSDHPQKFIHSSLILLTLGCGLAWRHLQTPSRQLVYFFLFTFLSTFMVIGLFYSFGDWRGARSLLMFIPAGVLIVSGLLALSRLRWLKYGILGLLLGYFIYGAIAVHQFLTLDRQQTYQSQHQMSQTIISQVQKFQPQTVMVVSKAYLYGWEAYPVTLIIGLPANPAQARALAQIIPIDIILVNTDYDKLRLIDATRQGIFNYRLVNEFPGQGEYYMFINQDRLPPN